MKNYRYFELTLKFVSMYMCMSMYVCFFMREKFGLALIQDIEHFKIIQCY